MAKKPLTINLADKNSVSRVIKKVQDAKTKVATAHDKMIMKLTEDLVLSIKANAMKMLGISWAGESIHARYIRGADGLLIGQVWGADYIVYIEYGTGDTQGEKVKGARTWVYYDDRIGFVTTYGQKPRPFIRTSIENYRMKVQKKAEVVFSEWIALT